MFRQPSQNRLTPRSCASYSNCRTLVSLIPSAISLRKNRHARTYRFECTFTYLGRGRRCLAPIYVWRRAWFRIRRQGLLAMRYHHQRSAWCPHISILTRISGTLMNQIPGDGTNFQAATAFHQLKSLRPLLAHPRCPGGAGRLRTRCCMITLQFELQTLIAGLASRTTHCPAVAPERTPLIFQQ